MIELRLGELLSFDNWLRFQKPEYKHLAPQHRLRWITDWTEGALQGEETKRAYAHWLLEK